MKYFAQQGIAANRMTAVGKGAATPIADNITEAGKAQNRRIEIEFTDPDQGTVICQ
jgi:outer membrane protein OmpA-like peptidoglycan-associated protein